MNELFRLVVIRSEGPDDRQLAVCLCWADRRRSRDLLCSLMGRARVVQRGLRGPLGLKGWALGRLRLKRLKTCHGKF